MQKIKFITAAMLICQIAQSQTAKENYVLIKAGDTEKEIIARAARVVPSARQLRWQKLELTTFFHFGVNTFTDKEWGDGTEDPKIFNPKKLDAKQWIKNSKRRGV